MQQAATVKVLSLTVHGKQYLDEKGKRITESVNTFVTTLCFKNKLIHMSQNKIGVKTNIFEGTSIAEQLYRRIF